MARRTTTHGRLQTACMLLAACAWIASCAGNGSTPAPNATPTETPGNTPTDTPTETPTDAPTNTPTHLPTPTSTFTGTPSSTPSPSPTLTLVPTSTATPTNAPVVAAIAFVSAQPTTIYVRGAGLPDQSVLTFHVTDALDSPIAGVPVAFSLDEGTDGAIAPPQATTDSDGNVQVTLRSGNRPLSVQVGATIVAHVPTIAARSVAVNILSGVASAKRFVLAHEFHNISGRVLFGLTDRITAFANDRDGNPVPPDEVVSFTTTGGAIINQSPTDRLGQATATLVSQNPLPTNGIVATLATTRGERSFEDHNGNGVCDDGIDTLAKVSEPFSDSNCNGLYDAGEPFIDLNDNGIFDEDQGTGSCSDTVTIFSSICTTFSGPTQVELTRAGSGAIAAGGLDDFTLVVSDDVGNPIVGGSTVTLSVAGSRAQILGLTTFTIPDALSYNKIVDGVNRFRFRVVDAAPTSSASETDAIFATVTSEGLPAGWNGSVVKSTSLTFLGAPTPTPTVDTSNP